MWRLAEPVCGEHDISNNGDEIKSTDSDHGISRINKGDDRGCGDGTENED